MQTDGIGAVRVAIDAALACVDNVIVTKTETGHEEVTQAVRQIIRMRDAVLQACREDRLPVSRRDEANAIVSLAFGTMFPLVGVHLHRFEQTREALRALAGRI